MKHNLEVISFDLTISLPVENQEYMMYKDIAIAPKGSMNHNLFDMYTAVSAIAATKFDNASFKWSSAKASRVESVTIDP